MVSSFPLEVFFGEVFPTYRTFEWRRLAPIFHATGVKPPLECLNFANPGFPVAVRKGEIVRNWMAGLFPSELRLMKSMSLRKDRLRASGSCP
jgi:hypothetical protein